MCECTQPPPSTSGADQVIWFQNLIKKANDSRSGEPTEDFKGCMDRLETALSSAHALALVESILPPVSLKL
jgi:hypothetical protein